MAKTCYFCGRKLGFFEQQERKIDGHYRPICDGIGCTLEGKEYKQKTIEAEREKPAQEERAREEETARLASIVLTTSSSLPNDRTYEVLEIITAECAFGMNVFRDMFAAVRDLVGGRSEATQNVLRDARKTCLTELRREAYGLGADAVIAVDLDYSEFSGGGKSMLFLVAGGTAIKYT